MVSFSRCLVASEGQQKSGRCSSSENSEIFVRPKWLGSAVGRFACAASSEQLAWGSG
jgi:hypothetical protein